MRLKLLLGTVLFALYGPNLFSCGGSSGGMGGDVRAMDTTIAYITGAEPANVELSLSNQSINPPSEQSCQNSVCIGGAQNDTINITIRVESIKNALGQPVVPNPSPVRIEGYTVVYSIPYGQLCARGSHSYKVDQTVTPDANIDILVNLVPLGGFTYCNVPIRGMPFLQIEGGCPQDSYVEFKLVEIYTGKTRTLKWIPQVILTGTCQ